jgi:tetratricopeptide (TPR) repeat protein
MRLITIPVIILVIFIILSIATPVLLLEGIEGLLPADVRENTSGMRENFALLLSDISSVFGRYDTCVDLYDYLISRFPAKSDYYGKKALNLQKLGRLEETITTLDMALALEPEDINYLLRKARLSKALYRNDESDRTYKQINQLTPKNAIEYALSGDASLDQGKYTKALEMYTESLARDPENSLVWEKRGDVIFALLTIPTAGLPADQNLKSQDLFAEGTKSYENAIRLNPEKALDIKLKMSKKSDVFIPQSIAELESRYTHYRYLG